VRIPAEPWRPIEIETSEINRASVRSPLALLLAVAPLGVTGHPRYQSRFDPKTGKRSTYCNIFLWDATRLLHAEIPHYSEGRELTARGMIDWLQGVGPSQGWRSCDGARAREHAGFGCPAAVVWRNPKVGSSHVALLLPSPAAGPQLIAQAGSVCLFGAPLARGFGNAAPLEYFAHE
jgi:hypothetical protein